jgi:tetratricopeptide (TPR) repeat protein
VKRDSTFGTLNLVGTVTRGGHAVEGVTVRLSGASLATPRLGRTDVTGHYLIEGLPPGDYSMQLERGAERVSRWVNITSTTGFARIDVDLSTPARDNVPLGTLAGVVRTEEASLPGVTIVATGSDFSRAAVSDASGNWRFMLPAGRYAIKAELEGMKSVEAIVDVTQGRTTRHDFNLTLNAVAEAITVTSTAPAVLETTEAQSNYGGELVEELPVARTTTGRAERASAPPPPPPAAQVVAPALPPPPAPAAPIPQPVASESQPAPAPVEAPAETTDAAGAPIIAREGESPAPTDALARPVPLPPPPIPSVRPAEPKPDSSWIRGGPKDDDARQLEKAILDDPMDRRNYTLLSDRYSTSKDWPRLADLALRWQPYDPENPQVYEALGEAALAAGRRNEAIRAFASIAEIAPSRPELLQRAGLLLMKAGGGAIAEAPLRRALELRPDRVNAYRHLAIFLWKEKRFEEAAAVLEQARLREFPDWYGGVQQVIAEELGYVYRAWAAAEPKREAKIRERAREYSADMDRRDALRITLAWETDASDVDLHVVDPRGDECFYSTPKTGSGLQLYGDITQGLGPEVVRTGSTLKGVYSIGVNYFDPGPMGVSRGIVTVIRTDRSRSDPDVEVLPFRLVEATHGSEVRLLAKVKF